MAKYLNETGLQHALAGLWARVSQALSTISLTPGPPGAKGDKGDKGDTGNTGATSSQGPQGNTGATGAAGAKGVAFYGWNTAANLTNISSISGMAVGDFVVNTGTATRTMLGLSTEIGGVVCATSTTTGTAAGNIRGATGLTGATGATGSQGAQGNPGAQGAAGAKGVSFYGWSTAANLTNISSITGMVVGDYVVNNTTATRTMLGVSTVIGGVVRSTSATAGAAAGNIMGYTPPTSGPLANMTLTDAIAYINQLLNGQHKDITLDVNVIKVPLS